MHSPALDALWMPYTPNRQFKATPRLVVSALGLTYRTAQGREVLDGISGLWCVGAGHRHPKISEAMKRQLDTLDFASSFQVGHPGAFELAERIAALAPPGLDRVFLVNSGSEACDTAMKIALAYAQACGQGQRGLFVGRERAFHGVGFGGISVGGMTLNRRAFAAGMLRADHLRSTWDAATQAFVRGQPASGAEMADELETRIIALHGASNIAAVIVEPMAGSTGVLVPPLAELMHGYTCSGHPLACAAALAMIDVIHDDDLLARVRDLAPHFEAAVHSLADAPGVVSVRNIGLAAGVELAAVAGAPGQRGAQAQAAAFDRGLLTRAPGDTLVLAPPFISSRSDIDRMVDRMRAAIQDTSHAAAPQP